jgi:hypothetical protein
MRNYTSGPLVDQSEISSDFSDPNSFLKIELIAMPLALAAAIVVTEY